MSGDRIPDTDIPWAVAPAYLLKARKANGCLLSGVNFRVYLALRLHTKYGLGGKMARAKIAREAGTSPSVVSRSIAALQSAGLLRVEARHGCQGKYFFIKPDTKQSSGSNRSVSSTSDHTVTSLDTGRSHSSDHIQISSDSHQRGAGQE
jgi:predicted transcriptional regulator